MPTATTLPTDDIDLPGQIDQAGDVDMFKVTPTTSGQLVLRVSGLALGMDPKIRLFKADGTPFNFTAAGTVYFFTTLDVTANQSFYVEISHQDSNATTGLYNVSIGQSLQSSGEPELSSSSGNVYLPIIVK